MIIELHYVNTFTTIKLNSNTPTAKAKWDDEELLMRYTDFKDMVRQEGLVKIVILKDDGTFYDEYLYK